MMKSGKLVLAAALLALVACNKDDNKPKPGASDAFSHEGVYYETLQEAVDALSSAAATEIVTITLNKDVTDDGAVLPEGEKIHIQLDLGNSVYTINPGCSIETGSNFWEIKGDGGAIHSEGDAFSIKCGKDGLLRLDGNITLHSDNVLSSSSPVEITENFEGSIEGNITLDGATLNLAPSAGNLIIPVLSVNGDGAAFSVDALKDDSIGKIAVGKIQSDREYPVVSIREDAVTVSEGKVHVHNFECEKIDGTCCVPDSYVLVCKDCGYGIADFNKHEITYGKCGKENLVKHEKVEASECQFGNVEYYECPDCGSIYLNADCTGKCSEGEEILLPTNIDSMMNAYENMGVVGTAYDDAVDIIVGLVKLIPSVVAGEYKTWTTPIDKFRNFSKRLTELSSKLDDISNQISKISTEVKTIPYIIKVQDRLSQLTQLKVHNQKTNEVLGLVFNNPSYTQKQMEEEKAKNIKQWSGIYEGSTATLHPQEIILGLMNDFSTVSVGPNVPEMYGEVLSSYFLWEHLGYAPRVLMLMYDVVVVSTTYYYAQNYARVVKPYSSDVMRDAYRKTLEKSYEGYAEAVLAELQRMKDRDAKYRRYMPTNTTYDRDVYCSFNFVPFFMTDKPLYLPRSNARVAIDNCNEMMEYKGGKLVGTSFMDFRVANETYQSYLAMKKAGKLPEKFPTNLNAYQILDSLGFNGQFSNKNFRLLMNAPQSFSYAGGDIQYPLYWNVKWRSYAGLKNSDWIDVAPVLKYDGTTCSDRLADGCNIWISHGFVGNLRSNVTTLAKTAVYGAIKVTTQDQTPKKQ